MDQLRIDTRLRIARPSRQLASTEKFWTAGVGLSVLWRSTELAVGEHALVMLGMPGAAWHLELVDDPAIAFANPPSVEDLLVCYLGEKADEEWLDRIERHGGTVVPSKNPYWDRWGVTLRDPDGYLLVLSHRGWQ